MLTTILTKLRDPRFDGVLNRAAADEIERLWARVKKLDAWSDELAEALSFMTGAIDPEQSEETADWELTDVRWRRKIDALWAERQEGIVTWHYRELLQGNSCIAYVMDGDRVVCRQEHHGIMDLQSPGLVVERTRREFREIVLMHEAARIGEE